MLVKYNLDSLNYETISNSVPLVPRLEYSVNLLNEIITMVETKRYNLKESNHFLINDFDEKNESHVNFIKLEQSVSFCLDILLQIRNKINCISSVKSIPKLLSSSISVIRIASAKLFDILPYCSHKLSELSVHLGSIVLDSASITQAKFDFSDSNDESVIFLDKVKLMADSKISKQYPNLDFLKQYTT